MRTKKLIRNDVQLKLTLYVTLLSVFVIVMQFMLFLANVSHLSQRPGNLASQEEVAFSAAATTLLTSLVVIVPLSIAMGILTTFRIAGPIYRFGVFLRDVRDGRETGRCELRKGDQLQDLCELLNEVTEPLRKRELRAVPSRSSEEETGPEAESLSA